MFKSVEFYEEKKKIAELVKKLVSEGTIIPTRGQLAYRSFENAIIIKTTGKSMIMPNDYCVVIEKKVYLPDGKIEDLHPGKNVSNQFPIFKVIFDKREDVNVIIHFYIPYVDVISSFLKGKDLISPDILWGLKSGIPIEEFPHSEKFTDMKDITKLYESLSQKYIVKEKNPGFIVEHLGTWLVASDLDIMYVDVKILELTAKTMVYKKILGMTLEMPTNLKNLMEKVIKK